MADTAPVQELNEAAKKAVSPEAGEKPSVLPAPSAPPADALDGDEDESEEEGEGETGLDYLYSKEELDEEEPDDDEFEDAGAQEDEDDEYQDDEEEEDDPPLAQQPLAAGKRKATESTGVGKRAKRNAENDE